MRHITQEELEKIAEVLRLLSIAVADMSTDVESFLQVDGDLFYEVIDLGREINQRRVQVPEKLSLDLLGPEIKEGLK